MTDDRASATEVPAAGAAPLWENYSSQELRAIIGRGLAGGDEVARAIAETERRSRTTDARDTPALAARPYRNPSFRNLVVLTIVTIVIALAFGLWLAT